MIPVVYRRSNYSGIKRKVYSLLDPSKGDTIWDKVINSFIVCLIILNTLAVILETVDSLYSPNHWAFHEFDIISVGIFTIEYVLRVWSCTSNEKYRHPVWGRLKYMFSFGGLIDLVAILPFYLPLVIGFDLRFLRLLRLIRLFRFLKLGRYMKASRIVSKVLKERKEELLVSFVLIFFLVIVVSCLMYFVEHDVQPNKFSNIPETMWWSISTLTTVGYGDMYPITPLGKALTSIIAILGIGTVALPAGILASGFFEEFRKHRSKKFFCPHCGNEIEVHN